MIESQKGHLCSLSWGRSLLPSLRPPAEPLFCAPSNLGTCHPNIRKLAIPRCWGILINNMERIAKIRLRNGQVRSLFVAFLAILLVFGTTIQLTHVHKDGAEHADCALCQSSHNVVRPEIAPCIQHVLEFSAPLPAPFKRPYREHLFSFSHWNRPPPDQTSNS